MYVNRKYIIQLFHLSWPIFIELLLQMSMMFIDLFMLSFISDEAVAAIGVTDQILFLAILVFSVSTAGTSVLVAQYVGKKDHVRSNHTAATSISLSFMFGLIISLVMIFFHQPILRLMNISDSLMEYGQIYLSIVGGALVINAISTTIVEVLRSNGYTRDPMIISFGINGLNVFGNYLFIFGALGFPEWGVTGVAISTVFSKTVGCIILFVLLQYRLKTPLKIRDFRTIRFFQVKKILGIGIPSAAEQLSSHVSQLVITFIVTFMGVAALAAKVYVWNIMFFMFIFGLAIGKGTLIITGQLVGANKKEEAYRNVYPFLLLSMILTLIIVLLIVWVSEPLLGMFTENPEIIETGSTLLLLCLLLEPGRNFNLVIGNALRSAGDIRFPVVIGVIFIWVIGVPLAYLLGIVLEWGLIGIWISFIVDEWCRGIVLYFRWKRKTWQTIDLLENKKAEVSG